MKKLFFAAFVCFLFFSVVSEASAQDKLIILVRHAEKADETSEDPELNAAGIERAARLIKTIGKFKPGAFYSTNYKRTRDTVTPWAAKRNKQVQVYDAKQPKQLIEQIMKSDIKRHVVSGHSNTIPGLANLLTGKELFKNLNDAEYGTIWVIRIKDGKLKKAEILPY